MKTKTKHGLFRRHVLLGFLGLTALGIHKIPAATPLPENAEWVLVEMNGKAVEALAKEGGEATLKLDAAKKA